MHGGWLCQTCQPAVTAIVRGGVSTERSRWPGRLAVTTGSTGWANPVMASRIECAPTAPAAGLETPGSFSAPEVRRAGGLFGKPADLFTDIEARIFAA
jgi:hypothetical protein